MNFLTISHTFGDGGGRGRPGGETTLRALRLLGWPKDIGVTVECFNCNLGAARTGGTCPHQVTV